MPSPSFSAQRSVIACCVRELRFSRKKVILLLCNFFPLCLLHSFLNSLVRMRTPYLPDVNFKQPQKASEHEENVSVITLVSRSFSVFF